MAKRIAVPGMGVVEFPDDMNDAQIVDAIKRNTAAPERESYLGAFGREVLSSLPAQVGLGAVRGAAGIGSTLLDINRALSPELGGLPKRAGSDRAGVEGGLRELGAEPSSIGYQGGKLAAELAGTAGIGGLLAKGAAPALSRVAPRAAPAVTSALESFGMRTGLAPTTVAGKAGNMALRMGAGGATGYAGAGLVDPSSAATGGMIGAALPPAISLAGKLGTAIGHGAQHVAAMVSNNAAEQVALRKIRSALGDGADMAALSAATHVPPRGIPLSTAAITKHPELAVLEQGSRLRVKPAWAEFDKRQAESVWDSVKSATDEGATLAQRARDRARNWAENWAKAEAEVTGGIITPSKLANQKLWVDKIEKFGNDLEVALQTKEAANPQVRAALETVAKDLERFDAFSPGHLQVIRAELNGKIPFNPPNALKAAPRDSPAIISLKQEMDGILNAVTNGKWSDVKSGYARDSAQVYAAKAANKVRGSFVDADTGMLRTQAVTADVPTVTQSGLRSAIDRARLPDQSLALSSDSYKGLQDTLDALISQGFVGQVKKAATGGGGSDTASNLLALGGGAGLPAWLNGLLSLGRGATRGRIDAEMAGLLMSPNDFASAMTASRLPGLLDDQSFLLPFYRLAPLTTTGQ